MTDFCYQHYISRWSTGLSWPATKPFFSSSADLSLIQTEAKNRLTYMLAENPDWRNKELMIALEIRGSQVDTSSTDYSILEMRVFFWMKNATKDYCTRGSTATDLTKITYSPWLKNDGVSYVPPLSGSTVQGHTVSVATSLDALPLKDGTGAYNKALNTLTANITPETYVTVYLKNYYYNLVNSTGVDASLPANYIAAYIYRPSHIASSTYASINSYSAATATAVFGTKSKIDVYLVKGDPYVPPVPLPVAVEYNGIYGLEDRTVDVDGGDESSIMARVYNGDDILKIVQENPNFFLQKGDKLLQYYTFIKTRSYR